MNTVKRAYLVMKQCHESVSHRTTDKAEALATAEILARNTLHAVEVFECIAVAEAQIPVSVVTEPEATDAPVEPEPTS